MITLKQYKILTKGNRLNKKTLLELSAMLCETYLKKQKNESQKTKHHS